MKTKLLLLTAVTATITLAGSALAGDAVLSPKAKELRNSVRRVSGITEDRIDRSLKSVSPKVAELEASYHRVPAAGPTIDLAHAQRPTMAPKDPRFETAWRRNATAEFQVAPLK